MKRIFAISIVALLASCFAANGQNLLEQLGQRAKNAVENKLGEKVEQGVNDAIIDEVLCTGTAEIGPADLKIIRTAATE